MDNPKSIFAQIIIATLRRLNISDVVISPGSRNAPLIIAFTTDSFFNCYSVVDERSAGFVGLGMALQTNRPTVLVCTSGSAVLNYYPAVAEAFYSQIPLIVISADRPIHKIDIGDGQTIRQSNVFANHILKDLDICLEEDLTSLTETIETSELQRGPVHINVPFEEPLYETTTISPQAYLSPINRQEKVISETDLKVFEDRWKKSKRTIVLAGQMLPNLAPEIDVINLLSAHPNTIVLNESTSNFREENIISNIDRFIAPIESNHAFLKALRPELLITFGGIIISKKIKTFLRKYPPKYHFHIDPYRAYDTFFCLTHHFKARVNYFFKNLKVTIDKDSNYKRKWLDIVLEIENKHNQFLQSVRFSDFLAYALIFESIPKKSILHVGNSSAIRYQQLYKRQADYKVYCNRGTSGIEGSVSTSVGSAIKTDVQNILICGDISFFYDSNALWNKYIKPNFRIIIINNNGGGIFRILDGKDLNCFPHFFETTHSLTAEHLTRMYNFEYEFVDNEESLKLKLIDFYEESEKPKVLEISTPRFENDTILKKYFSTLSKAVYSS